MKRRITIKRASVEDAPIIINVTHQAFEKYLREGHLSIRPEALNEGIPDVVSDIKDKIVLLAFFHDEAAGSVRIKINDDNTAYISRFGVLPKYSRVGIGKAIMDTVDEILTDRRIEKVSLHTAHDYHAPMQFYHKHGFKIRETESSRGYQRSLLIKTYGSK